MAGKMERSYKARGGGTSRRDKYLSRTGSRRATVTAAQRGYVRTAGYYARFRGRRTGADGELKFFDTSRGAAAVAAAGVVDPNLVIIPQNDTESGRIGRKVTIRSIYIRGYSVLSSQAAVGDASDVLRVMVVQDKQANGAVFAVTDVLASASWLGHKNLENSSRFRTLMDKEITINQNGGLAAATFENARSFNSYLKCFIPIEYDASSATGAITTQRSNSIAVLAISQNGKVSLGYNCRVRYSDN